MKLACGEWKSHDWEVVNLEKFINNLSSSNIMTLDENTLQEFVTYGGNLSINEEEHFCKMFGDYGTTKIEIETSFREHILKDEKLKHKYIEILKDIAKEVNKNLGICYLNGQCRNIGTIPELLIEMDQQLINLFEGKYNRGED